MLSRRLMYQVIHFRPMELSTLLAGVSSETMSRSGIVLGAKIKAQYCSLAAACELAAGTGHPLM